jgi:hypothetical protein
MYRKMGTEGALAPSVPIFRDLRLSQDIHYIPRTLVWYNRICKDITAILMAGGGV